MTSRRLSTQFNMQAFIKSCKNWKSMVYDYTSTCAYPVSWIRRQSGTSSKCVVKFMCFLIASRKITISRQDRKVSDEGEAWKPAAKKFVLLPGEKEICELLFDTHCHLDCLYSRYWFRGTLEQFLKEQHWPALHIF